MRRAAHPSFGGGDAGPHAVDDRLDRGAQRQPAADVQRRRPADLDVARAIGGDVLDQLVGDALERLVVLHDRDGQIEGAQQIGLVAAALGRDEPVAHCREVHALVEAALSSQFERRLRAKAAVEVQVQLRLGHAHKEVAHLGRRFALRHSPIVRQHATRALP